MSNFIMKRYQALHFLNSLSTANRNNFLKTISANDLTPSLTPASAIDAISPDRGTVLLVASEGNPPGALMLKMLRTAAEAKAIRSVAYVDFGCNGDSAKPFYRMLHDLTNDPAPAVCKRDSIQTLRNVERSWQFEFSAIKKHVPVVFLKTAKALGERKSGHADLVVSFAPRKQNMHYLAAVTGTRKSLIVETEANSLYDVGSRAFLGLDSSPRSLHSHRKVLGDIERIAEYRQVMLAGGHTINLVRVAKVDDLTARLGDSSVSIASVMQECSGRMPAWSETAERAARECKLTEFQTDDLLQKASRLDSHSRKATAKVEKLAVPVAARRYANQVVADHLSEAVEVFQDVYRERKPDESVEVFVKAMAIRDYIENAQDDNLIFQEALDVSDKIEDRAAPTAAGMGPG